MLNLLGITHQKACEYLSNPLLHETVISVTIQINISEGGTGSAEAHAAATVVAQHATSQTSTSQGADSAAITDLTTSASSTPDDPAPPTVLPPSGRISTRTRRRAAAAADAAPPAVDYGFRPGGAPRPFARRTNTPPRVPRP